MTLLLKLPILLFSNYLDLFFGANIYSAIFIHISSDERLNRKNLLLLFFTTMPFDLIFMGQNALHTLIFFLLIPSFFFQNTFYFLIWHSILSSLYFNDLLGATVSLLLSFLNLRKLSTEKDNQISQNNVYSLAKLQ